MYYNKVLELKQEDGVGAIGYADDLALVISGRTKEEIIDKTEYAVWKVGKQLEEIVLAMEVEKTEIVILEGRRKFKEVTIKVGENTILSKKSVRYLGVTIGKDTRMTEHVKVICEKAVKIQNTLARLMPKIGGPSHKKRKILATTVSSVVLYAAPAWQSALKYKKYANMIRSVERKYTISITAAYRTVATEAAGVIAGCPPLDLMVWERTQVYKGRKNKDVRKELIEKWQRRWDEYEGWAKVFIKDVSEWMEKGPATDYYLTQAISGHGAFGSYLKKIKKVEDDDCWFGCGVRDTPEHTLFQCARFEEEKMRTEVQILERVSTDTVAGILLEGNEKTNALVGYLRQVIKEKVKEETIKKGVLE